MNIQELITDPSSRITVLTGAGISAESGIPTFRGPEGFWTIGSINYHPQEMATRAMFLRKPWEVWKWYIHRLIIYRHAKPNAGHHAAVEMERLLGRQFSLITQNIDNLHISAGSSESRTMQIHGNIYFMRCSAECKRKIYPLPPEILFEGKDQELPGSDRDLLSCLDCGAVTRPHVLWFDEYYNEHYFRCESALAAAAETDLLIIAGTSGTTNLPNQIAGIVSWKGKTIIDINIEESPFTRMALRSPNGGFLKSTCSKGLVNLLSIMKN